MNGMNLKYNNYYADLANQNISAIMIAVGNLTGQALN
jgi:hypothetical protein